MKKCSQVLSLSLKIIYYYFYLPSYCSALLNSISQNKTTQPSRAPAGGRREARHKANTPSMGHSEHTYTPAVNTPQHPNILDPLPYFFVSNCTFHILGQLPYFFVSIYFLFLLFIYQADFHTFSFLIALFIYQANFHTFLFLIVLFIYQANFHTFSFLFTFYFCYSYTRQTSILFCFLFTQYTRPISILFRF